MTGPSSRPVTAPLRAILVLVAALAIVVPALIVAHAPRHPPRHRPVIGTPKVVPKTELPEVDPVQFQDLAPEDARTYNASVPFSSDPNPPARPFRFVGDEGARARATDCLAAAVLYEAGDDAVGEEAVAQVILNRLRHPAFPKTVCGVVFEGSERTTGCQFTFTCDGALAAHTFSDIAWARARAVAMLALNGFVFAPVGYSTHYHTDWVVPYWSSSLDKVGAVHTHLFYRWTGWWGTPPAFRRIVSPDEPVIPLLARLSDAHKTTAQLLAAANGTLNAASLTDAALPQPVPGDKDSFLVALDPRMAPDEFAALALRTCGDRTHCKFMAWSNKANVPFALPLAPGQVAAMSFSYLRDHDAKLDKALWNCSEFQRTIPAECMKHQVFLSIPHPIEVLPGRGAPLPGVAVAPNGKPLPDGLAGVRRGDAVSVSARPILPSGAAPSAPPPPSTSRTPLPMKTPAPTKIPAPAKTPKAAQEQEGRATGI